MMTGEGGARLDDGSAIEETERDVREGGESACELSRVVMVRSEGVMRRPASPALAKNSRFSRSSRAGPRPALRFMRVRF